MNDKKLFVILFVLVALLLAACSSAAPAIVTQLTPVAVEKTTEPLAQAIVAAPTAAQMAMAPTERAPAEVKPEPAGPFPIGRFVSEHNNSMAYQYNDDGTFEFYYSGKEPVFVGKYSVDGNLITIENPSETEAKCIGEMTYKWSFDGSKLTFAPTSDDPCKPRREANADTYFLAASPIPEIKIDAADYSYTEPDTVNAGWVRVILTNSGQEPHHVQFMRLNDGVSMEQFGEALKQGEGPAMALVSQVGGVGAVAPGGSAQAVLNLPDGEYAILCLIPSATDHAPHFAKGMIKSLTVQPANGIAAEEPSADLIVSLVDFAFDLPEIIPAKPVTIKVVNEGPEAHEFNILRLVDGKTFEDVTQYLAAPDGPPPFIPMGGMNGLDVGLSGYIEADLQPGAYVAICNIPSPKAEGHPHFTLGMIRQFTVEAQGAASFPTGKFVSVHDQGIAYQFNPDGTFGFYFGSAQPVAQGTYKVVGSLLSVINPDETDPQCQGSVTYQWAYDGKNLTFSPLGDDTCRLRRESFGDTYTVTE
jgi:uncharacterized cupredoxin-like copper-binding protein